MKPTRTARQLQTLLQARIAALPGLDGATDVDVAGVVWRVASGRDANWTVPTLRSRDSYRSDIARIIRQVQDEFDLEE